MPPVQRAPAPFKIRASVAFRALLAAAVALLLLFVFTFHRSHSLHMEEGGGDAKLMTDLLEVVSRLEQEHEELHTAISALESGAIGPESIDLKAVTDAKRQADFTKSVSEALEEASPKQLKEEQQQQQQQQQYQRDSMQQEQQPEASSSRTAEQREGRTVPEPSSVYPAPITFTSQVAPDAALLVVGGTDGSGTRRVVQTLASLGVLMVSEDPETFDIHADGVGGWPPVVSPVVRHTKTLQYSIDKLPADLQSKISSQLSQLVRQAERDSTKPTSHTLAVGGALPRPHDLSSSGVKYGFKAPVAMTLVPFWASLAPAFKFLHVLRDGRDIAFSANQGPVAKFYADMYGPALRGDPREMAIRLWSDWNAQIYQWAKGHASERAGRPFGYYALHSEDLVSSEPQVRFAAIYNLAKWVGSTASDDRICCLAQQGSSFMGSHDRTPRGGKRGSKGGGEADLVSARYGKWRGLLAKDAQLRDRLQRTGAEGLRVFGYEPPRSLAEEGAATALSGYQCRLDAQQCAEMFKPDVIAYSARGACAVHAGRDYRNDGAGSDISSAPLEGADEGECCRRCQASPGGACRHFTVDMAADMCYLKSRQGVVKEGSGQLVSGDLL